MFGVEMGFEKTQRAPLWEGIVFPGIEVGDSRFEYYEAKPRQSLEKFMYVGWLFRWNIPTGEELPHIVVPNPCIRLGARVGEKIFKVHGPRTLGAIRKISGKGMVLGLDLVPGAFFSFSRMPVGQLVNSSTNLEELWPRFPAPDEGPWSVEGADDWFVKAQDFLETLSPDENNLAKFSQFFRRLWSEDEPPSLDQLAEQFGASKRSTQRIFLREIGMSPRDAIRTTRLHKALRIIGRDDTATLASVALESGFFDQPHMVKEFKALVNNPPAHLRKFL
jgi:AraC-like DNA-binding protein